MVGRRNVQLSTAHPPSDEKAARLRVRAADRRTLSSAAAAIRELEPTAQIVLYGSRARGTTRPDSDWDLLVLLDGEVDRDRDEALHNQLRRIESETRETISLIVHSHDEWNSARHTVTPFHANVTDDGIDLATMRPAWPDHAPRFTEAEMAEARDEVAAEWMKRARSALTASRMLAGGGFWNECVSRLYYGCFDAVRALLLVRGFRPSRHSHVQSLFNEHLVRTGVIPGDLGDLYNELFKKRGRADYEAFARFTAETVQPWMDGTQRLIDHIAALLAGVAADPGADAPSSGENR